MTDFTKHAKLALEFATKQSSRTYKNNELYRAPTSALIQQDDAIKLTTDVGKKQDHLRVAKAVQPLMHNPLFSFTIERKFEAIYDIIESFIKQADVEQ